jgi:O-antigen ligase
LAALGGQFTPFQILMAIGVAKFLLGEVVMKHTRLKMRPRFDAFLIMGFMAVLTWHGIHDRFGMKFLGSSIWGGRNYVNVFVGLVAFAVIQSTSMPTKLWTKLPHLVLAVTTFDLLIGIITTVFPASIYKIYPFYSAVSVAGVEEIVSGASVTGRIGTFGNFGFILILIILASVSFRRLFHPSNFRNLVLLAIGGATTLYSGFRSAVINSFLGTLMAGVRDLKGRVVFLVLLIAVSLAVISFVNSEMIRLPKQVQRSLTFLPGNWDTEMAQDATSSNEFRELVWTTWTRQYFPVHPFIGRGFGFKSDWGKKLTYRQNMYDTIQVIETGNIHNGFLASLDAMGIIGTIFFVLWNLRLLIRTLRIPFNKDDPAGVVLRFVALYLGVTIISYWMGAQDVGSFLPREFALAGLLLRLQREDKLVAEAPTSSPPKPGQRIGNRFAVAKG